jgi:hypothetical protein
MNGLTKTKTLSGVVVDQGLNPNAHEYSAYVSGLSTRL